MVNAFDELGDMLLHCCRIWKGFDVVGPGGSVGHYNMQVNFTITGPAQKGVQPLENGWCVS